MNASPSAVSGAWHRSHSVRISKAISDSAALRRTATVVRNRRDVADGADFKSRRSQRTHRRFTARARPSHAHVDRAQTVVARLVGCIDGRLLRGERCALTRPAEAERTRTLPRQRIALAVGDRHDRVVERRLNVNQTVRNILAFALLELLVLAGFALCC